MAAKQSKQPNSEAANEKDKAHPAPVTVIEATPVSHETHDGFDSPDEGGSDSILKGEKLKFTRGATWIDRSETVIDPKREFIVAEVKKVIQKWIPDVERPETTELGPDEFFPDIEKMNAEAPQSECDALKELVKREMEGVYELEVPLVADVGTGPNWRDAK